jgi:3-oxoacyl-[acyl-carrier protein] reductase
MDFGIAGKTAMVTGGSRGIGREIARLLAVEGVNVNIVARGLDAAEATAQELSQNGGTALALRCDVSDSLDVSRTVEAITARFGALDILVNNAGIGPPYLGNRIVDMPEDHFDRLLSVHVKGAFLCTKYAARAMICQQWGRIVNIGSIHGISGGRPGLANYATAKAGLEGFTKAASLELAPQGITVNCVAPGFTKTEMLKVSPEMEAMMIRQTPVGKLGEVSDIARLVVFLVSTGAGHITGATIRADGGRTHYVFNTRPGDS